MAQPSNMATSPSMKAGTFPLGLAARSSLGLSVLLVFSKFRFDSLTLAEVKAFPERLRGQLVELQLGKVGA